MQLYRALALASLLLAACTNRIEPTPEPQGGFDCNADLEISGVVEVENPVEGRYIVVFEDQSPGIVTAADIAVAARSFVFTNCCHHASPWRQSSLFKHYVYNENKK